MLRLALAHAKAAKLARANKIRVVLRGSPLVHPVPEILTAILAQTDVLVVNELEAPALLSQPGFAAHSITAKHSRKLSSIPALHAAAEGISRQYTDLTVFVISAFGIAGYSPTEGHFTLPLFHVDVRCILICRIILQGEVRHRSW
jgi:hypothetical protein